MNTDVEKYQEAAKTPFDEESDIEERVSMVRAEEILEFYKREVIRGELEFGSDEFGKQENMEFIKEKIFVDFGEDIQDVFLAFNHYGLNHQITDEDRKIYTPTI